MSTRVRDEDKVQVYLVGCGEPKKSMGWFHLTQLRVHRNVNVAGIVEPYFLGEGQGKPGCDAFAELRDANPRIGFHASIEDLPPCTAGSSYLFLIAGRTCDTPKLFLAAIEKGATHIYLEKPGADCAERLAAMRDLAAEKGVHVVVGYNKNVAEYSRDAMAELFKAASADGGKSLPAVTLEHCNDFRPGEDLVVFMSGPGGEGMLHNMCCHELALASTLFGVTCARVKSVQLHADESALIDLGGGKCDWQKVTFTLVLEPAANDAAAPPGGVIVDELTFSADRCGGNYSRIRLQPKAGEPTEFRLPSAARGAEIAREHAADPEMRPYFLQQAPDYERLKGEFIAHILSGQPGIPAGVVGLDGALEALKLADLLKPTLTACSKCGKPWRMQV